MPVLFKMDYQRALQRQAKAIKVGYQESSKRSEEKSRALLNAFHHLIKTGESTRKAARKFGVPESTLRTRVNNPGLFDTKVGRPSLFSKFEEEQLAEHCQQMAQVGYVYGMWQVLDMATNMMNAAGGTVGPKKDWFHGYVKRFPHVVFHNPKLKEDVAIQELSQVHDHSNYLAELEIVFDKYGFADRPELVWSVDETWIVLDHIPPKILAAKFKKRSTFAAGRSNTNTVIVAGSAKGETIPPFVIYKGQRLKKELTNGCLPQTKFGVTSKGWATFETFKDFLENHFMLHVTVRPCLLLYDGHCTHVTVDIIREARQNDIHMFVLPPTNNRHNLPPLDVGIFSPFKNALFSECQKFCQSTEGCQVTRSNLPALIGSAYLAAMTVPNLTNAFRKTGILADSSACEEVVKVRKDKANVRSIKLLLTDVDDTVISSLTTLQGKKRKIVVQTGGAITASSDQENLKDSAEDEPTTAKRTPSMEAERADKKGSTKGRDRTAGRKASGSTTSKTTSETLKMESSRPVLVNSVEASSSKNKRVKVKGWQTFYDSDTDDDVEEDDAASCCVCNMFCPLAFEKECRAKGKLEILQWAKCDRCRGWVHLKYCTSIQTLADSDPFTCPHC